MERFAGVFHDPSNFALRTAAGKRNIRQKIKFHPAARAPDANVFVIAAVQVVSRSERAQRAVVETHRDGGRIFGVYRLASDVGREAFSLRSFRRLPLPAVSFFLLWVTLSVWLFDLHTEVARRVEGYMDRLLVASKTNSASGSVLEQFDIVHLL